MASAPAWQRSAAARSLPAVVGRAASACRPNQALFLAPARTLARPGRLPNRQDFLRVQAGRRCAMPGFVLQAAPVPVDLSLPVLRVGFTVIRNRVRRRLREVARLVMPDQASAALDYVLVGRQGALERDFAKLQQELVEALKRLKALAPSPSVATP